MYIYIYIYILNRHILYIGYVQTTAWIHITCYLHMSREKQINSK